MSTTTVQTTAPINPDPLMDLLEVAAYTKQSLTTVRRWHYRRELKTFRLGRSVVVRRSEVDRFLTDAEAQTR
ncbi:helix-turn-helix domain-containing protein [Streptomyces luteireticuli]|uniref:Helix-turn-helix domain-containing protein n=1 Tax=Streptomyces luteireticuli TaxID=173858 RepID=A0ABN0Y6Q6_9ACTN